MDMTDVSAMRPCKRNKKDRHSNGGASRRTRNHVFAKSPKNPKSEETTVQKKNLKNNNVQKGTGTAIMKKSNKLRALWKGCFVRRSSSIHHTSSEENIHQHDQNWKVDHGMVTASSFSSSKSAITAPPLTISISTTGPSTLYTVSSSSIASSSPSTPPLCLKDFAQFAPPPLEQRNRVNFSEFIFSIPEQVLHMYTSARLSLDDCGSNLLHLACFQRTTTHDAIRYIFDNCSQENQQFLLTTIDQDGNLPSHILVSSICRQKIDLDDGLKILKLFYEICPEAIFELNSNEELVTDIAYGFRRNVHEDSSEFLRLDTLYSCLRDMMSQVWLKRKLQWEEMGHEQIDFDAIRIKNIKSYWRSFHDKRDGEWKPCC
ncbi:predicted protein [Chaetoceros tenuissimus]|uniref:Uncharacterized protein n=1 Tax=Chaetoceros tenuissimus TaxID=426638 RepID=A0AAD3H211_9STRA|nr:predicted protein [Chaetoceros tenuissimus]